MRRHLCLICEDEMLIGMDVAARLEDAGMAVAGPFTSGGDALAWAATNRPDVAVLDYSLRDGECLSLIRALQAKQVPVVIYSGWLPNGADLPPEVSGLPWVKKPDNDNLLNVLAEVAPTIIRADRAGKTPHPVSEDRSSIHVKSSDTSLTDALEHSTQRRATAYALARSIGLSSSGMGVS